MKHAIIVFCLLVGSVVSAIAATVPGEQAQENGFLSCQTTVEKIAQFVTNENKQRHGSLITWNKNAVDTRLFNAQVVLKYSDGNSVAVLNVMLTKSGKCDGSYTKIITSNKSCTVLRETTLKELGFGGELGGLTVLENQSRGVSTILLPIETGGCTMILTETIYG